MNHTTIRAINTMQPYRPTLPLTLIDAITFPVHKQTKMCTTPVEARYVMVVVIMVLWQQWQPTSSVLSLCIDNTTEGESAAASTAPVSHDEPCMPVVLPSWLVVQHVCRSHDRAAPMIYLRGQCGATAVSAQFVAVESVVVWRKIR